MYWALVEIRLNMIKFSLYSTQVYIKLKNFVHQEQNLPYLQQPSGQRHLDCGFSVSPFCHEGPKWDVSEITSDGYWGVGRKKA